MNRIFDNEKQKRERMLILLFIYFKHETKKIESYEPINDKRVMYAGVIHDLFQINFKVIFSSESISLPCLIYIYSYQSIDFLSLILSIWNVQH